MKTLKFNQLMVMFIIFASVIVSCKKTVITEESVIPVSLKNTPVLSYGGILVVDLIAGQHINAGSVVVSFDDDFLYVDYTTANGWMLDEVHLWVGSSLAQLPRAGNGNPKIGHFPYKASNLGLVTNYGFTIPLSGFGGLYDMCGNTYYVAAHAVVKKQKPNGGFQSETAWGNGQRITLKGNWAMYFGFIMDCYPGGIS
jgi:hypothetical protein